MPAAPGDGGWPGRAANAPGAAVALDVDALHQPLGHELVGDAGHVAARHHHAARELVHLESLGRALELRHQVEARQRGGELRAQSVAHLLLDQLGAGEQPKPQPQCFGVFAVRACFEIHVSCSTALRATHDP